MLHQEALKSKTKVKATSAHPLWALMDTAKSQHCLLPSLQPNIQRSMMNQRVESLYITSITYNKHTHTFWLWTLITSVCFWSLDCWKHTNTHCINSYISSVLTCGFGKEGEIKTNHSTSPPGDGSLICLSSCPLLHPSIFNLHPLSLLLSHLLPLLRLWTSHPQRPVGQAGHFIGHWFLYSALFKGELKAYPDFSQCSDTRYIQLQE